MRHAIARSLITLAALALVAGTAQAEGPRHPLRYAVTITNLTRGQIFSPPLIVTHPRDLHIFQPGTPASAELAALAQDGDAGPLSGALTGMPGVHLTVSPAPVPPGQSVTLEVGASHPGTVLSLAAMLVSTNDAFVGLSGVRLPLSAHRTLSHAAPAYDAGAEDNDESCMYIPGPPCGHPFADSGVAGEGFVHVHAGIHGIADLDAAMLDWRNPVARITIRRLTRR